MYNGGKVHVVLYSAERRWHSAISDANLFRFSIMLEILLLKLNAINIGQNDIFLFLLWVCVVDDISTYTTIHSLVERTIE